MTQIAQNPFIAATTPSTAPPIVQESTDTAAQAPAAPVVQTPVEAPAPEQQAQAPVETPAAETPAPAAPEKPKATRGRKTAKKSPSDTPSVGLPEDFHAALTENPDAVAKAITKALVSALPIQSAATALADIVSVLTEQSDALSASVEALPFLDN